jgi:signal peptidase I
MNWGWNATTAIAKFIKDYNYPALVVCCRQEEWQQAQAAEVQETQFGLNGAVYLEPLTDRQIQSYLQQVKRPRLWAHIQSSDLQALLPDGDDCKKDGEIPGLRSPLLLNMLLVAYKDGQVIRSQSELFQAYIKEQFVRSGKSKYTEAQTRRYLVWLARQLKAEKTTEFEIENLQPSWLENSWYLYIYRLITGLIAGLIFGLFSGLIFGLFNGLIGGLITELTAGLIFGLINGSTGNFDEIFTTNKFYLSSKKIRQGIFYGMITGSFYGSILGLFYGIITGLIHNTINELIIWLFYGIAFGLFSGAILGLILGIFPKLKNNDIYNKRQPNEGMWNASKGFIIINIVSFSAGVLLFTLPQLVVGQSVEWEKWIICCLSGGMFLGTFTLLQPIKHVILRLLLWANGSIPWNYAAFLDHANKLRLVQSMGGRYRFVHDLLREEMIGSTPPACRLASHVPEWIRFWFSCIGILVASLAGLGIKLVSPKLAQITMPILHTGEFVFFDEYSYLFINPQRYDLVTFQAGGSEDISHEWIIGLPGENIYSQDHQLLINGKPIDRPYTHFPPNYSIDKPFKVPAQSYFVMGKRIDEDGEIVPTGEVVHRERLINRCIWRLWPLQRFGAIK